MTQVTLCYVSNILSAYVQLAFKFLHEFSESMILCIEMNNHLLEDS
jgi:hypothetical protein